MRISQLSLRGHGAWPDLHVAELSGEFNLFCARPCGGKSTLAQLIGHLLYGKTDSPRRQPFGQLASPADGSITLQSAAGTFVLRRRESDNSNSSTLTIAATDGAAVNGQTVQALLGDLSPHLAAQLFAVDFAESPQVEWLLSDSFAREFTANLRADTPLESPAENLDRQRIDELVQQHHAIARQIEQHVQVGRREATVLQQQSSELDQAITTKRQQVEQLQSDLCGKETRLTELAARLRYFSLESTAVGGHRDAEQHDRQLGELDSQISHCRQTLDDLQTRAVALQTELAQSRSDGTADSVTCLADGRATLGMVERLLDDLDAEVAQLARAKVSSRPVGSDAHARFTPLANMLRQQLYTLCGQWSEEERRTHRQQLLAESRQLSRAQTDMSERLEQLLARREALLQQAQSASQPVLLSPQPPVAEHCRCEHHQQFISLPSSFHSSRQAEQLQREQDQLQRERTVLLDELAALGQEILQLESEWKQLQQEQTGLIGSATIETKRVELNRLESILQQAMDVKVHDPTRTSRKEWRASDLLAQLTDGQLVQIRLTRQHTAATIVDSEGRTLSPEQLTSAQRDQLYVALTLALVSSYANRRINLPLILDEPFLRLDAAATAVMAGVLEEFARAGHQLLVFTEDVRARRTLESLSCRVFDLDEMHRSEETLEGHETSGLRLASGHGEGDIEAVFYLSSGSSLDEFPVLGDDTSLVFARQDILTVGDLLAADPKQIADHLDRRDIAAEVVELWQSHMSLLCHVPELTLNAAQLLTACGITSPMELREASGDQLWSAVESFLATDQAQRFVSADERYSRARIGDWIYAAGGVGSNSLETVAR